MRFRISLKLKIFLIFVLLSLIVSLVSLSFLFYRTINGQLEELKASLLITARMGADSIESGLHEKISLSRSAINSPAYQRVRDKLVSIRKSSPRVRYAYTLIKDKNDQVFFVVDSADIEDLFSYPGDRYESLTQADVLKAFNTPIVNDNLVKDEWGYYMSGYAPIKNAAGETVAVLGLDIVGDTIESTFMAVKRTVAGVFLLCVVLSGLFGFFFSLKLMRPINKLIEGTNKIARGDLGFHVIPQRNDELGKLAESFNQMADALRESDRNLRKSFFDTIRALTVALEAKDPYTRGHSERVMNYGVAIAKEMGFPDDEIEILQYLYVMHDIGKIGVDDNILNKPGSLSEKERQLICEHSEIGAEILKPISFLNDQMTKIVKSHHEYQDGSGYPEGLKGDEIPISVAILTVADSFDAMITDRPYRKALPLKTAVSELKDNSGTQFRQDVVDAFIRVIEKGDVFESKAE